MPKLALLATLKAKPGQEQAVEDFLQQGGQMVQDEPKTVTWYALKFDQNTYGIFDTFEDEEGRQAHLNGDIAAALMEKAPELFSEDPDIKNVEILANK